MYFYTVHQVIKQFKFTYFFILDRNACTPDTCDQLTGQCYCKSGTEGLKCDTCRWGLWDLRSSNPEGCRPCFQGSTSNTYMYSDANNICQFCDAQCLQCNGPNATDCLQCRNYKFGNTCVASCPSLFYPDLSNVCQPCNSECILGCTGEKLKIITLILTYPPPPPPPLSPPYCSFHYQYFIMLHLISRG